jgi:glutamyl-tRNA synthetase
MHTPLTVRFAPSPTGRLHIGGARTALYNYLLARKTGGRFILRIEDTDRKRLMEGAEEEILEGLRWLGLDWDEGPDVGGPHEPYRQSLAKQIYRDHAKQLIEKGWAYPCFCSPERIARMREQQRVRKEQPRYDGACRDLDPGEAARRIAGGESHVVRFKSPREGATTVSDLLRGEIRVENSTLDDFILVKSDGLALYHLAAMVDDHRMGVSHVIRGSEWLSTLPLHALVVRAFGWREPVWCHLSVFLKPSGKGKMSKRDSSQALNEGHSIFVRDLEEMGYLPEGIANWIALMGASFDPIKARAKATDNKLRSIHKSEETRSSGGGMLGKSLDDEINLFTGKFVEVLQLNEMVKRFNIKQLNPSPAAIDFTKLDNFNGKHIRLLSVDELAARLQPVFAKAGIPAEGDKLRKVAAAVQVRIVTLDDAIDMGGFFFRETISPRSKELIGKGLTPAQSADALHAVREILAAQPSFHPEQSEPALRALAKDKGCKAGVLFAMMREALSGQAVCPPLFDSMDIIGRDAVLARLEAAEAILRKM